MTPDPSSLPRRRTVLHLLLAAIAVAGAGSLVFYVLTFGTNVPIGDDWDLLRTIVAWRTDGFTASSLFAFHNEHRIVATRLVAGVLLPLVDGNLRVVMLLDALFVVATLGLLLAFVRRETAHPLFLLSLYAATVCLVVGWFQWQNLLWSFQLPWLLLPLLLVACIWSLCFVRSDAACAIVVGSLLAVALACQANGVLVWFACVPAVFARLRGRSRPVRWVVASGLVVAGVAATGLYFAGMPSYVVRPSVFAPLEQPLRFLHFYLAVLGSPFSAPFVLLGSLRWFGVVAGGCGVVAAVLALAGSWRRGWAAPDRALFVLGLGLLVFSAASVFAISLGRFARFSPDDIESRYTTFALYFHVATLLLFFTIIGWDRPVGRRTGLLRTAFLLACAGLVVGSTWGDTLFDRMGLNLHLAQLRYKASLTFSRALPHRPELLTEIHTVPPDRLEALLSSLEDHRLWVPGRPITVARDAVIRSEPAVGNVDDVVDLGDRVVLKGWSRLPDGLPADAVLAMTSDAAGALVPVAISSPQRIARPDLVATFGPATVLGSGWSLEIAKADVDKHPLVVAYSAARNTFFVIPSPLPAPAP